MKTEDYIKKNHKEGLVLMVHSFKLDRDNDALLQYVPQSSVNPMKRTGWAEYAAVTTPPEAIINNEQETGEQAQTAKRGRKAKEQ